MKAVMKISCLSFAACVRLMTAPTQAQDIDAIATLPCLTVPDEMSRYIGKPADVLRKYVKECSVAEIPIDYVFVDAAGCQPLDTVSAVEVTHPPGVLAQVTATVINQRIAPDLVQKTYQDARRELKRCQLGGEFLPRAVLVNGEIASTLPPAGTPLREGEEMIAWTVSGTRVPNVVGLEYQAAKDALKAAEFQLGKEVAQKVNLAEWQRMRRRRCGYPSGTRGKIVNTSPPAETLVPFTANDGERAKVSIAYESAPVWTPVPEMCRRDGELIP
ncbi:PASTA domain-containing protein [Phaeobacter inhibens]|uniref:PASTA domain-containing protein n=1 Tax=Phaeobacter inhibens TaxID=221822 RepID=UPI000C9CC921|nr:hypothetical protein [Phaeobacter inhibens]AUQ68365.1 PASTA domain protein [Phaeobacter inhibens]